MSLQAYCLNHARISSKPHRRIKLDDKMAFFQQLGSLMSARVPLLQALQICAEQSQSLRMRAALEDIAAGVAAGRALHEAMVAYPKIFESHWLALISTGEISSNMDQVLEDLNEQIRESQETKRKISGAMMYPCILAIVAVAVIIAMLWFVVPTFGKMFEEMNAELPAITQYVMGFSDYIVKYGVYVLAAGAVLIFLFRQYMKTEGGSRLIEAILMSLPIIGDLSIQSAMYRFSSNLSLLLKSGVPMLDTLEAMACVFRGNPAYCDAMIDAQRLVSAGRPLAESLEESGVFTTMMTNTVRIGEESAQLGNVMTQIAPYYKEKTNSFLTKVTKLLEPCIIVVMGFTIAIVMLAIYIPMFEMSGKVN